MKKASIIKFSILISIAAIFFYSFKYDSKSTNSNKPKKVIFIIGDGMGLAQISGVMSIFDGRKSFERFPVIGLMKTHSSDNYITDSGAGATVFSIGEKTYNGAIGVDKNEKAKENLFEKLKKKNWATGVVVTSSITHATPACFYAHAASRSSAEDIAEFLLQGNCDIAVGGGMQYFTNRKDKRNLFAELQAKGFVTTSDTTSNFIPQNSSKYIYTLAADGMKKILQGRGDFLKQASLNAIQNLSKNKNGYMLMIEGSQIDWGGHENNYEYMKTELLDLNDVINAVLDEAQKRDDLLVVVTSDHETGGLALNADTKDKKKFIGNYSTKGHSGIMVPVFAFGPGANEFAGVYENTEIFFKFKKLLNLK